MKAPSVGPIKGLVVLERSAVLEGNGTTNHAWPAQSVLLARLDSKEKKNRANVCEPFPDSKLSSYPFSRFYF